MSSSTHRIKIAAREFNDAEQRTDGDQIALQLSSRLKTLRDLLYMRIHRDVERVFGMDSMLAPVSEEKMELRTIAEIEAFQVAAAAAEAAQRSYVADAVRFSHWLARLRFGSAGEQADVKRRIAHYLELDADERRLAFAKMLGRVVPESRKAPLVLFHLFPLAVAVATAQAFADAPAAAELRRQQIMWLPSIEECSECQGRLLDHAEICSACSNPVWNFRWLTDAED